MLLLSCFCIIIKTQLFFIYLFLSEEKYVVQNMNHSLMRIYVIKIAKFSNYSFHVIAEG